VHFQFLETPVLHLGSYSGRTNLIQQQSTTFLQLWGFIDMRRAKGTINKNEILKIITDTFSSDLDIEKSDLTRDDKFSWAT